MLSKSTLTRGGQSRCPTLEAFLGPNRGIFGAFFFNLPIRAKYASRAFWGQKMVPEVEEKCPQCFELDPNVYM